MGAIVRRAVPADLTRVQEIAAVNRAAAQWSEQQYDTLFADKGEQYLMLVIEDDKQVEGFIVARLAGDQWEIENIAVEVQAQRRGKGSQLFCEFLKQARQHGTAVFLEVRESNIAARKFYEKMGFVEAGRRKSYYHEPAENALILQLSF